MSRPARIVFVGRLPRKTRWGTRQASVSSAATSSSVLPKASASAWAKTFAISRSWCRPTGTRLSTKPMRSAGISFVPWWMSW